MVRKSQLLQEIIKINEEDELYWFKRSHEKWLLEGDNNTEYFHRVANGRKRRNTIITLMDGENIIEGDEDLLNHATEYYRNLFGPVPESSLPIDPNLWEPDEKVTDADNSLLTCPFSEEEIKHALFQMDKNKAAGPDKIPVEFYQACWDTVKSDVLELFEDFHRCGFDMRRLNYGIITLLPKI